MFLKWFDTSEAERLALTFAEIVISGYPASEKKNARKGLVHRAKLLDKIFEQARQFKQEKKPNFYKKAKLGNTLKWKLLEDGFEREFVDDLTYQILLQLK
jgi:hypothetical protein